MLVVVIRKHFQIRIAVCLKFHFYNVCMPIVCVRLKVKLFNIDFGDMYYTQCVMVSNNSLSNSDINTQTQKKQQNRCFILVSFHLVSQGTNKKSGLVF